MMHDQQQMVAHPYAATKQPKNCIFQRKRSFQDVLYNPTDRVLRHTVLLLLVIDNLAADARSGQFFNGLFSEKSYKALSIFP
jgi:hypothetical protein